MVLLETHIHDIQSGDIYLMCSDGLSDMLRDPQIAAVMSEHASLPEMGAALIAAAWSRRRDNIAVVLFERRVWHRPLFVPWWPFKR